MPGAVSCYMRGTSQEQGKKKHPRKEKDQKKHVQREREQKVRGTKVTKVKTSNRKGRANVDGVSNFPVVAK